MGTAKRGPLRGPSHGQLAWIVLRFSLMQGTSSLKVLSR